MARITFSILFFVMVLAVQGQQKLTFPVMNDSTYSLYEQQQWKQLLKVGKEGLKQGFDFYYLRMRLGIAAYERHNYIRALSQFKKALGFSSKDPVALEYLYYCYVYLGMEQEARKLYSGMPVSVKRKIHPHHEEGLSSLALIPEYYLSDQGSVTSKVNQSPVTATTGWRTMLHMGGQASVFTGWNTGSNGTLTIGYRFLSIYRDMFTEDETQQRISYTDNVYRQHHIFSQYTFRPFSNALINISANYINLRPRYAVSYGSGLSYSLLTLPENNFTGNLSFQYRFPYFSIVAGAGLSKINRYSQIQEEAGLVFYPLGNINLYVVSDVVHAVQLNTDPAFRETLFGTITLGARILKPVWLEGFGSMGDRYNVQLEQGTMLYNEFNPVSELYGANILISVPKNRMMISAGFTRATSTSYYFYEYGNLLYRNEPISSNTYIINGGIKWTF